MIEPTSSTPGNASLSVREFEQFQKALAEKVDLRHADLMSRLEALTLRMEDRFDALTLRMLERFAASDHALDLAEKETQRRLDMLNGEQARLGADRERFLSKETYDVAEKDRSNWRDVVNAFMSSNTGREKGVSASWSALVAAIGAAAAIGALLSRFLGG